MSQGSGAEARAISRDGIPGYGSVILGKYQIEKELGAGGMGVVVAARHVQLNQLVAVKFLRAVPDSKAELGKRFLREARAAASLKSDHVARVMDVGTLDSGVQFMVMEHLEGQTLSKLIRARAPMPVDEVMDLMLQACEALGEAHARGIVHRDVKPGNLFVTQRSDGAPLLKVLDFGISKAPDLTDEQDLTATNLILGSPHYVSPEQLRGVKFVDHRTDIWALGVVLYYMLAGRRPFEAETVSAVCYQIAADPAPRLSTLRPEIPPELDEIVMRCLEKDRTKRVETIGELAKVLATFASSASRVSVEHIARQLPPPDAAELAAVPRLMRLTPAPPAPIQLQMQVPFVAGANTQSGAVLRRPAPSRSVLLPVVLAVAGVGVLVALLLKSSSHRPVESGGVEGVTGAEVPAGTTSPAGDSDTPVRTILPIGTNAPKPAKTSPTAAKPVAGGPRWGHTKGPARLFDKVGSSNVIADIAPGELVFIQREAGSFALVAYTTGTATVSGWMVKAMIEED